MSAVVHPVSENPRLRISAIVKLLVARQRLAALDELRTRLPLDDPDRHALDSVDAACALMNISFPDPNIIAADRRKVLLRAVKAEGGQWKAGRAIRLYESLGYGPVGKSRAAHDLRHWERAGLLKRHDKKGVTYYTRRQQGDDRA